MSQPMHYLLNWSDNKKLPYHYLCYHETVLHQKAMMGRFIVDVHFAISVLLLSAIIL